jgi:hypothetical protein
MAQSFRFVLVIATRSPTQYNYTQPPILHSRNLNQISLSKSQSIRLLI